MEADKRELRAKLRQARRGHVASLEPATRALLFLRPPRVLVDMVAPGDVIGLYSAMPTEAPAGAYARFFAERGHDIALPRFSEKGVEMAFARWIDPVAESDLEVGPLGVPQPTAEADILEPDILFVPLLGFTADGGRLGQGGGHYDRFLAERPGVPAIGLAWDVQLVDDLPQEPHDVRLNAVVTPTRLFGPFG